MSGPWKYAITAGIPMLLAAILSVVLAVQHGSFTSRIDGLERDLAGSNDRVDSLRDELEALRAEPYWTPAHDTAIRIHTGPWRTRGAFVILAEGSPQPIPPGRTVGTITMGPMLRGFTRDGMAEKIGDDPDLYEITEWGREVYAAYLELPDHILGLYYCLNWRPGDCSEHHGLMLDRARAAIPEE
jgi:hypothetical protein